MKHNIAVYIIILAVAVVCGTAVLAQGLDDQGKTNDPRTNSRANACFAEGSLEEACVTPAQWECGWMLIRFEYGLLSSLPTTCASLFPNMVTATGQNPFLSVTAFDANATPTPSSASEDVCAWTWGTQTQEWLAQYAQSLIQTTGYQSSVSATSYGENCLNQNNEFVYFAAQYTVFDVTVTVPAGTDEAAVQSAITTAIKGIAGIPGASAPQITVHFVVGEVATSTPIPGPYPECYWYWARQPLPDVTERARVAVSALGYVSNIAASAYGEDCTTRDGQFIRFAAMSTEFNGSITISPDADENVARQAVYNALRSLSGLPGQSVNINLSIQIAGVSDGPIVVPTAATEEATPEASPEIDTTPEPLPPTEEATATAIVTATVPPMPTATPRTGDCKPTDPCGGA